MNNYTNPTPAKRQIISYLSHFNRGERIWSIQVLSGLDSKYGKPVYKVESEHATKEEAQNALNKRPNG